MQTSAERRLGHDGDAEPARVGGGETETSTTGIRVAAGEGSGSATEDDAHDEGRAEGERA